MTKKVTSIVVNMRKKSITLKWRRTEIVITKKEDLTADHTSSEMMTGGTSIADLNMKK